MIAVTRRALGPPPKYLPTLAEIAAECAKIRAGWTAQDWIMRRHGLTSASAEEIEQVTEQAAYTVPMVSTAGLSRSECHLFAKV